MAAPAGARRRAGRGRAAEAVVVPNFWDPRARIERPSAEEIGAIRFLTTDDFPPFAFKDRRGILVGFDIDLAAGDLRRAESSVRRPGRGPSTRWSTG